MADVNAIINIDINSSSALLNLKRLESQIDQFNRSVSASNATAAASQQGLNKALLDGINNTGLFTSKIVPVESSMTRFSRSLDEGRLSLGEYTRYAGSQLPGLSRVFRREFDSIEQVATSRVKSMQTQYLALGKTVDGVTRTIASTPTGLARGMATDLAMTQQRQQIFNKLLDDGSTKLLNWGKNTQWAGRQLMVGFSLPLAAFGAVASKTFMEIDKATISLKRVYGDLSTTREELNSNVEAVKGLGREYTKYGITLAETISLSARAAATGATNEGLMAATEQTLRFATLGQMDYNQALDTTISLQTAFAISNEDLGKTVDYLNAVENQTILTMEDMSLAIPRVATVVKGLGGSVEDLAVMMTAMREGGVSAENAANGLKSGLASLINPTKRASESLASMGVNLNQIITQNKGDLMGIVTEFGMAINKLDEFSRQQLLEQVFGKYQYARMSALFTNITKDAGQAARAMDIAGMSAADLAKISEKELGQISESTSVKFQASMEQLKMSIAPIGEAFLKGITPIVDMVSKIADAFNNLPDGVKNAVAVLTGVVAGIGPVILMTIGLLGNGIANITKFVQFIRKSLAGIKGDASAFTYLAQGELEATTASKALEGSAVSLTDKLLLQRGAVSGLTAEYERFARAAGLARAEMGSMSGAPVPSGGGRAPVPAPRLRRNTGGTIPGVGSTDTVPAMLTPGEFVINKQATAQNLPLLHAINDGQAVGGFNKGGQIPGVQNFAFGGGVSQSAFNLIKRIFGKRKTTPMPPMPAATGSSTFLHLIKEQGIGGKPPEIISKFAEALGVTPRRMSQVGIDVTSGKDINSRLNVAELGGIPSGGYVTGEELYNAIKASKDPFKKIRKLNPEIAEKIEEDLMAWLNSKRNRKAKLNDTKISNVVMRSINAATKNDDAARTKFLSTGGYRLGKGIGITELDTALNNGKIERYWREEEGGVKTRKVAVQFEDGRIFSYETRNISTSEGLSQTGGKNYREFENYELYEEWAEAQKRVPVVYNPTQIQTLNRGGQIPRLNRGGQIPRFSGGGRFLGMPKKFNPRLEQELQTSTRLAQSGPGSQLPLSEFATLEQGIGGYSAAFPGLNGIYVDAAGRRVVYKSHPSFESAEAEMLSGRLMSSLFGLESPSQVVVKRKHPVTGDTIFGVESAFDQKFAISETVEAGSGRQFTPSEAARQFIASGIRRDRDLQPANIRGNIVVDQGVAVTGVNDAGEPRAMAQGRTTTTDPRSVSKQLAVNAVMEKSGAKKFLAESLADIARSVGPDEFERLMVSAVSEARGRLHASIDSLPTSESTKNVYRSILTRDFDELERTQWRSYYDHLESFTVKGPPKPTEAALKKLELARQESARSKASIAAAEHNIVSDRLGLPTAWARGVFKNTGGPIFESQTKIVPGVGSTDTVPAMLTPGEFVINKQATRENLPLLHAINDGKVINRNRGGQIPGMQYFATPNPQRVVQSQNELINYATTTSMRAGLPLPIAGRRQLVLVDLDGTIMGNPGGTLSKLNPEDFTPIEKNIRRIRELRNNGIDIEFVTARPPEMEELTRETLRRLGLDDIPVTFNDMQQQGKRDPSKMVRIPAPQYKVEVAKKRMRDGYDVSLLDDDEKNRMMMQQSGIYSFFNNGGQIPGMQYFATPRPQRVVQKPKIPSVKDELFIPDSTLFGPNGTRYEGFEERTLSSGLRILRNLSGDGKTVMLQMGKYQPFHVGHEELLNQSIIAARKAGSDFVFGASGSYGVQSNNPLSPRLKKRLIEEATGISPNMVGVTSSGKKLDDLLADLINEGGYSRFMPSIGSDKIIERADSNKTSDPYSGAASRAGLEVIEGLILPRGTSTEVSNSSGTLLRELAMAGRFEEFAKLMPASVSRDTMEEVYRAIIGYKPFLKSRQPIPEEFNVRGYALGGPVTPMLAAAAANLSRLGFNRLAAEERTLLQSQRQASPVGMQLFRGVNAAADLVPEEIRQLALSGNVTDFSQLIGREITTPRGSWSAAFDPAAIMLGENSTARRLKELSKIIFPRRSSKKTAREILDHERSLGDNSPQIKAAKKKLDLAIKNGESSTYISSLKTEYEKAKEAHRLRIESLEQAVPEYENLMRAGASKSVLFDVTNVGASSGIGQGRSLIKGITVDEDGVYRVSLHSSGFDTVPISDIASFAGQERGIGGGNQFNEQEHFMFNKGGQIPGVQYANRGVQIKRLTSIDPNTGRTRVEHGQLENYLRGQSKERSIDDLTPEQLQQVLDFDRLATQSSMASPTRSSTNQSTRGTVDQNLRENPNAVNSLNITRKEWRGLARHRDDGHPFAESLNGEIRSYSSNEIKSKLSEFFFQDPDTFKTKFSEWIQSTPMRRGDYEVAREIEKYLMPQYKNKGGQISGVQHLMAGKIVKPVSPKVKMPWEMTPEEFMSAPGTLWHGNFSNTRRNTYGDPVNNTSQEIVNSIGAHAGTRDSAMLRLSHLLEDPEFGYSRSEGRLHPMRLLDEHVYDAMSPDLGPNWLSQMAEASGISLSRSKGRTIKQERFKKAIKYSNSTQDISSTSYAIPDSVPATYDEWIRWALNNGKDGISPEGLRMLESGSTLFENIPTSGRLIRSSVSKRQSVLNLGSEYSAEAGVVSGALKSAFSSIEKGVYPEKYIPQALSFFTTPTMLRRKNSTADLLEIARHAQTPREVLERIASNPRIPKSVQSIVASRLGTEMNNGGQIPSMQYFATPNPQRVVQSAEQMEQMALFGPHTPLPTADTDVMRSKIKSILKYVIPASRRDTRGLEIIDYIIKTITGGEAVVRTTHLPAAHQIRHKYIGDTEPSFDGLFDTETGQGSLFHTRKMSRINLDTIATTEPGLITEFVKMLLAKDLAKDGGRPFIMDTIEISPEGFKWREKARKMGLVEVRDKNYRLPDDTPYPGHAPMEPTIAPQDPYRILHESRNKQSIFGKGPRLFRNTGGPIFESQSKIVPGVGSTDTVPAMLTPGEFVINKQSTRENLPLLHAINNGQVLNRNKGGQIPGMQYFATPNPQRVVQGPKSKIPSPRVKEMATELTASRLHDEWRSSRLKSDGTYEPRLKDDGFGGQVDIANTKYSKLPSKWQEENRIAADEITKIIMRFPNLNEEQLSEIVHNQWIRRNRSWAPEDQLLPYKKLTEVEKEKDRVVARTAIASLSELGFNFGFNKGGQIPGTQYLMAGSPVKPKAPLKPQSEPITDWAVSEGDPLWNLSPAAKDLLLRSTGSRKSGTDATYRYLQERGIDITEVMASDRADRWKPRSKTAKNILDTQYEVNMEEGLPLITEALKRGITDEEQLASILAAKQWSISHSPEELSEIVRGMPLDDIYNLMVSLRNLPENHQLKSLMDGLFPKVAKAMPLVQGYDDPDLQKSALVLIALMQNKGGEVPQSQRFALGGPIFESQSKIVPGIGSTDTVPAMLTPGEFVINKQSTRENLPLLHAINDGNVSGYAKGGQIPGVQYFGTPMSQRVVQQSQRGRITEHRLEGFNGARQRETTGGGNGLDTSVNTASLFELQGQDHVYAFANMDEIERGIQFPETFNDKRVRQLGLRPQDLLEEALRLNPNDAKIKSMLDNFKLNKINEDELLFLDKMAASTMIDDSGIFSKQNDGMATILSHLLGDSDATQTIESKLNEFYRLVEISKKEESERISAQNKEPRTMDMMARAIRDKNPSGWDDLMENASFSDFAMVHSTGRDFERDGSGVSLYSTGTHNIQDGPYGEGARATIHFTANGEVTGGFLGSVRKNAKGEEVASWGDQNSLIVTSAKSIVEENGLPRNLKANDTWWSVNPGQALKLPNATVVRPTENENAYREQLISRGLIKENERSPVFLDDKENNDILYLLKEKYTDEDRLEIVKILDGGKKDRKFEDDLESDRKKIEDYSSQPSVKQERDIWGDGSITETLVYPSKEEVEKRVKEIIEGRRRYHYSSRAKEAQREAQEMEGTESKILRKFALKEAIRRQGVDIEGPENITAMGVENPKFTELITSVANKNNIKNVQHFTTTEDINEASYAYSSLNNSHAITEKDLFDVETIRTLMARGLISVNRFLPKEFNKGGMIPQSQRFALGGRIGTIKNQVGKGIAKYQQSRDQGSTVRESLRAGLLEAQSRFGIVHRDYDLPMENIFGGFEPLRTRISQGLQNLGVLKPNEIKNTIWNESAQTFDRGQQYPDLIEPQARVTKRRSPRTGSREYIPTPRNPAYKGEDFFDYSDNQTISQIRPIKISTFSTEVGAQRSGGSIKNAWSGEDGIVMDIETLSRPKIRAIPHELSHQSRRVGLGKHFNSGKEEARAMTTEAIMNNTGLYRGYSDQRIMALLDGKLDSVSETTKIRMLKEVENGSPYLTAYFQDEFLKEIKRLESSLNPSEKMTLLPKQVEDEILAARDRLRSLEAIYGIKPIDDASRQFIEKIIGKTAVDKRYTATELMLRAGLDPDLHKNLPAIEQEIKKLSDVQWKAYIDERGEDNWSPLTLGYAEGGTIPGVGNTDKVPAMLTPGEFVINKQATQSNLSLLHAINDGNTPQSLQGFNKGGMINGVQYLTNGAPVQSKKSVKKGVNLKNILEHMIRTGADDADIDTMARSILTAEAANRAAIDAGYSQDQIDRAHNLPVPADGADKIFLPNSNEPTAIPNWRTNAGLENSTSIRFQDTVDKKTRVKRNSRYMEAFKPAAAQVGAGMTDPTKMDELIKAMKNGAGLTDDQMKLQSDVFEQMLKDDKSGNRTLKAIHREFITQGIAANEARIAETARVATLSSAQLRAEAQKVLDENATRNDNGNQKRQNTPRPTPMGPLPEPDPLTPTEQREQSIRNIPIPRAQQKQNEAIRKRMLKEEEAAIRLEEKEKLKTLKASETFKRAYGVDVLPGQSADEIAERNARQRIANNEAQRRAQIRYKAEMERLAPYRTIDSMHEKALSVNEAIDKRTDRTIKKAAEERARTGAPALTESQKEAEKIAAQNEAKQGILGEERGNVVNRREEVVPRKAGFFRSGVDAQGNKLPSRMAKMAPGVHQASMGLGGGLMMASMAPMMMQDEQGKFLGMDPNMAMMGAMGAGTVVSMLPMLQAAAGPVAIALAAIAAIGIGFKIWRNNVDDAAKKTAELGANMGGTANSLNNISKILGMQTPLQRKSAIQLAVGEKDSIKINEKIAPILQSEEGQKFTKELKDATSSERFSKLSDYLRSAIAAGIMDSQTASLFAKAIGAQLNDVVLGMTVVQSLRGQTKGSQALLDIAQKREIATSGLIAGTSTGKSQSSGRNESIVLETLRKEKEGRTGGGGAGVKTGVKIPSMVAPKEGGGSNITQTDDDYKKIIGASIQIFQDFGNAAALAEEEYQNGTIKFKEYIEVVNASREAQVKYTQALTEAMEKGSDFGSSMQAWSDQLTLAGIDTEEQDILRRAATTTESFMGAGSVSPLLPFGQLVRAGAVAGQALTGQLDFETALGAFTSGDTQVVDEKKLSEITNAVATKQVSVADASAILAEIAKNPEGAVAKAYNDNVGIGQGAQAAVSTMNLESSGGVIPGLTKEQTSEFTNVKARAVKDNVVSYADMDSYIASIPDFAVGMESIKTSLPGLTGGVKGTEQYYNNQSLRAVAGQQLQGLTPEQTKLVITQNPRLQASMGAAAGARFQTSAVYQKAVALAGSRTIQGGHPTAPNRIIEGDEGAAVTGLVKANEKAAAVFGEKTNLMIVKAQTDMNGSQVDPQDYIRILGEWTTQAKKINDVIPPEIVKALHIDMTNPEDLKKYAELADTVAQNWQFLDRLNPNINKMSVFEATMVDKDGNIIKDPMKVVKNVAAVNEAFRKLGSKSSKVRKEAIVSLATSYAGKDVKPGEVQKGLAELREQYKDFDKLDPIVQNQMLELKFQYNVEGEDQMLVLAQLKERLKNGNLRMGEAEYIVNKIKEIEGMQAAEIESAYNTKHNYGGGGGGGSNPLVDFKKSILEQIRLYADLSMTFKKLFSSKMSFLKLLGSNKGVDDQLRAAGLGEAATQAVMSMGADAAKKWAKANITGGKNPRLKESGKKQEEALLAGAMSQRQSEAVGAIKTANVQRQASTLLASGKYGKAGIETTSAILGDPVQAEGFAKAAKEYDIVQKKVRQAEKKGKSLPSELEKEWKNAQKTMLGYINKQDKAFSVTNIQDQLRAAKEAADQQGVMMRVKKSLSASGTSRDVIDAISSDYGKSKALDELDEAIAKGKNAKGKGAKAKALREEGRQAAKERAQLLADTQASLPDTTLEKNIADLQYAQQEINRPLQKQIDLYQEQINLINKEIEALQRLNDSDQNRIRGLSRQKEMLERQVEVIARKNEADQNSINKLQREDEMRTRIADALNHELSLMSEQETKIREAYDKRIKALDEVARINDYIIGQQKSQLSLAQALSQGDVYAAAAAQQDMQTGTAQFAQEQMRSGLQTGMENQVAGLTTSGGLTRVQAEDQIRVIGEQTYQTSLLVRDLQDAIYGRNLEIAAIKLQERDIDDSILKIQDDIYARETSIIGIQRDRIQPLQDQITKIQEAKDIQDKNIQNQIDAYQLQIDQRDMADEQAQRVKGLAAQWGSVAEEIAKANKFAKDATETNYKFKPVDPLPGATDAEKAAQKQKMDDWKKVNEDIEAQRLATIASLKANGVAASAAVSAPVAAAVASVSQVGSWTPAGGGQIYGSAAANKAAGGIIGDGGRDSVAAMLTPGEYVMRKASVQKYGMPMLSKMNMGAFDMPRYNSQQPDVTVVQPTSNTANINAPVYNTYSVNVSANTNASADDIANTVMTKIKRVDSMAVRSFRGY